MFCTKCGNKLPDTAKFCSKCGNKVMAGPAPTAAKPVAPNPAPAAARPVAPNPAPAASSGTCKYTVAPEELTAFNYRLIVRDEAGNLKYVAESKTKSFFGYYMEVTDAAGNVAFEVKTGGGGLMTMGFDVLKNGAKVDHIHQKAKLSKYYYESEKTGIIADGGVTEWNFNLMQGATKVGEIKKDITSFVKKYTVNCKPQDLETLIAFTCVTLIMQVKREHDRRHTGRRRH